MKKSLVAAVAIAFLGLVLSAGAPLIPACAAAPSCVIVNDYGCYTDTVDPPTLQKRVDDVGSWSQCALNCFEAGFNGTAGVEAGTQCWCSNITGAAGPIVVPQSDCNHLCPDDHSKPCGGPDLLNEFSFSCTAPTRYSCQANTCKEDPEGPFREPTCGDSCGGPPPPTPPPPSPPTPAPPSPPSPPPGHSSSSLSAGAVLVIVFFSLVIPYFVIGAVIMRVTKGAVGTELLPHAPFWTALPGLIRDGFHYSTAVVTGRSGGSSASHRGGLTSTGSSAGYSTI